MLQKINGFTITVAGFVLLTLFFVTYNAINNSTAIYLNQSPNNMSIVQKVKNILAMDNVGSIDELAASDNKSQRNFIEDTTPAVAGVSTKPSTQQWIATDYKSGDIPLGTYKVKNGDTLWEIAEAVYGDGAEWSKILDANRDIVGFLPNGSQALIEVGLTLYIPR